MAHAPGSLTSWAPLRSPGCHSAEGRARRIGHHGHAAGREDVEGLDEDRTAGVDSAQRGLVGAGHGDVRVPGRRRRRIARGLRADARDVATAQARDEVAPGRIAGHLAGAGELPPEQGGVEGHRSVGVGLEDVDPAGHSRLVVVALAHRRLPDQFDWKNQS